MSLPPMDRRFFGLFINFYPVLIRHGVESLS